MCKKENCGQCHDWLKFLRTLPKGTTAADHEAAYQSSVPAETYPGPPQIPESPCVTVASMVEDLQARGVI